MTESTDGAGGLYPTPQEQIVLNGDLLNMGEQQGSWDSYAGFLDELAGLRMAASGAAEQNVPANQGFRQRRLGNDQNNVILKEGQMVTTEKNNGWIGMDVAVEMGHAMELHRGVVVGAEQRMDGSVLLEVRIHNGRNVFVRSEGVWDLASA